MNGLRSNSQQQNDRSSLDALNRTIEGLEARLEDLLGAKSERPSYENAPAARNEPQPQDGRARTAAPTRNNRFDPVQEIRQRQQALDARWEQQQMQRHAEVDDSRELDRRHVERDYRASTAIPPSRPRQPVRAERPAPAPAPVQNDAALREVAEALVSLRQELKHEISEGVAREMQGVRSELRNIRSFAENQDFAEDIREDVARLAASIERMGESTLPDADALRSEFEELRTLMDHVAREDSMHRMEQRFDSVDDTLRGFDTAPLQEEVMSLAYRLDDIKGQLGSMNGSPQVRALEDKLLTIASAVEHLGRHIRPQDDHFEEHFSGLDQRLDEISRAIAAGANRTSAAADATLIERLENRLDTLSSQIETIKDVAIAQNKPSEALGARLDALTSRIEELSAERSVSQLGDRLDQLSLLLERSQRPSKQPELTSFLTDISRKIDQLGAGAVNDKLAERLEKIARRIEEMEAKPASAKAVSYDTAFKRLEDRLSDIAAKLDETKASTSTDTGSLSPELDRRMTNIEEYMASSDEYIIEAARQAAEAVLEAHTRNNLAQTASAADLAILTELANDLRKLEGLSRNTEERTHRTFEALHETLVQIAGRLDHLDNRGGPRSASPSRQEQSHSELDGKARMPAASFPEEGLISQDARIVFENENARQLDTASAIDTLVPPDAEKPAAEEKRGLLSGLTRRFKSSAAKGESPAEAVVTERTQIDPAPALDPVDVLQANIETELLEPGSGAPDIKKILERVRASQTAAARSGATDGDNRADFIAAARRAAQVAAQESVPDRSFASRPQRNGAVAEKEPSALSRYRRPLLLGIGAILLAMMAMPAIKSFVGTDTTATAPVATPEPKGAQPTSLSIQPVEAKPAVLEPAVTVPSDSIMDEKARAAGERMQAQADKAEHLIDTRPIGGARLPEETLAVTAPASPRGVTVAEQLKPAADVAEIEQSTFRPMAAPAAVTETAPAQAQAPAPAIVVPTGITPPSLADAASKGDRQALFEIAVRYTDGLGVTADRAEAAKWYGLAADRGLAPAQYRLGNMYEKANGVERNLQEAKRYYQLAADQGNAGAMHNLAVLMASDAAGAPDFKAAADWFIKASNLGIRDSQFNLAILYARGSGVQQSLEESYKWFAIAAREGDADAGQKRDDVAKAMRPEQLESAKAKVEAWKVTPLTDEANSVNPPAEWVGGEDIKTSSVDMQKAIRNIQAILNNNGFKAGEPDGKLGKNTVTAIKEFQKSIGQNPDGRITDELVTALLARNK